MQVGTVREPLAPVEALAGLATSNSAALDARPDE